MSAPTTRLCRLGDVKAWLDELGVELRIFEKLVEAGVIRRITLTQGGRGYYSVKQIHEVIVRPILEAEDDGGVRASALDAAAAARGSTSNVQRSTFKGG